MKKLIKLLELNKVTGKYNLYYPEKEIKKSLKDEYLQERLKCKTFFGQVFKDEEECLTNFVDVDIIDSRFIGFVITKLFIKKHFLYAEVEILDTLPRGIIMLDNFNADNFELVYTAIVDYDEKDNIKYDYDITIHNVNYFIDNNEVSNYETNK